MQNTEKQETIENEVAPQFFFTTQLKANLEDDTIEGYISTSDPDFYKDIVTGNCMIDLTKQVNSGSIKLDFEHENFKSGNPLDIAKTPVGRLVSAKLDEKGVYVKGLLNKAHSRYEEIKSSLKNGFLDAFSIAYVPVEFAFKNIDGVRHRFLEKILLKNVALTGIPVNSHATIEKVMLKSIQEEELKMDKVDSKAKADEEKKEEEEEEEEKDKKKTETKSDEIEVKSLAAELAAVKKELAEFKSKKDDSTPNPFEAEFKALAEKVKALDEVMSKPQFKAVVENPSEKEFKAKAEKVETKDISIVSLL